MSDGADAPPSTEVRPIPLGEVDERAEQVMIRMRDGVRLATDVYLPTEGGPASAGGRLPTVLVRLPYDKCGPLMYEISRIFNDHGYAFVAQDVRGKCRSEGETFAFVAEVADGYDTIGWIASQQWSNGAVGTFGESYYGFTQWAAAASGHPALRAIVPRMTTTQIGADWMYNQGVFCLETMVDWAGHTWVDPLMYEFMLDWSVRPLADLVPAHLGGWRSASLDRWMATPEDDPFWTQGIFRDMSPRSAPVPALNGSGWWDVFRRGQLRDFRAMRAGVDGADQFFFVDATDHFDDELLPDGTLVEDYHASEEALQRFLPRYLEPAIPFLDRFVKGEDVQFGSVRWRLSNAGWREAETWPPAEARELRLYLADAERAHGGPEGGALAEKAEPLVRPLRWTHDPDDPVPSLIADAWRPLMGLPDERDVEVRDDVLTFTGEPAAAPIDLAGQVVARLGIGSSGPSMHVMAKLVDVFPNGRARRITEGARLVRDLDPDRLVEVDLGDTGYRLEPGHRLRLEVASSCFPRYLLHPGTDEDPWFSTRGERNEQVLSTGGRAPSHLCVSVLPAGSADDPEGSAGGG